MANSSISKRVIFPKRKQREFLETVFQQVSIQQVAKLCRISERTARDWRREKFSMDAQSFVFLCKKTKIPIPRGITFKDRYWYVSKGAKRGWEVVKKKYGKVPGNEEYRKKKWFEWWERDGKRQPNSIFISKPIFHPKPSQQLAEFVGILLGDGGISQRQVTVSLNSETEQEYIQFVVSLIKKLFHVPVSIYPDRQYKAVDIVVSRTKLVHYCVERLGLKIGDKVRQQVDIPRWVKNNPQYLLACLRGLVDTDGSVFSHRYRVNGKLYSYKKMAFSNSSRALLESVYESFQKIGLSPRFTKDGKDVRIESKKDVAHYLSFVGTHNLRYLQKHEI